MNQLTISDIRTSVYIGCTEEEKLNTQIISFNLIISFNSKPNGTRTDKIDDTICYAMLTRMIIESCEKRRFNLVEHLSSIITKNLSKILSPHSNIIDYFILEVQKMPAIKDLYGGIKWTERVTLN